MTSSPSGKTQTDTPETGSHAAMPQPRPAEPLDAAEQAAARISSPDQPLGVPGRPVDRRSPFFVSLIATVGVLLAAGVLYLVVQAADVLVLICLAFFIAVGLDPVVRLLQRRLPRPVAVSLVVITVLGILAGVLVAVISLFADHGPQLADLVTHYRDQLDNTTTTLGRVNQQLHLTELADNAIATTRPVVLEAASSLLLVLILMSYFLADLPRLRRALLRLVPASRRPRTILIGDEIFAKIGAYLLGNALLSLIAGAATFVWAASLGIPYPLLLALVVSVLDLIPIAGALLAGVLVSLFGLTVSLPVCLATIGFLIAYQLIEDYLLMPKIMGRVVRIPATLTLVAVLIGGVLLGVIGALVAIPLAAAGVLLLREICFPRLDAA
jgi:predicted PurR-regulated permease PerM